MSLRVCSQPGCPVLIDTAGRCPAHTKAADKARGTATQRGYNTRGHRSFRRDVLARDPVCMICHKAMSTVADHYPASRRDLLTQGRNPDDPNAGRGLCKQCHDTHTAAEQPGGWNQRD
jgi:5-methylcytosine-specific restriction protein A